MSNNDKTKQEIVDLERDLLDKSEIDSLFKQELRQDLVTLYNEPLVVPSWFDNIMAKHRGMLFASIGAVVLVAALIGVSLINQNQQNGNGSNIATSTTTTTKAPESFPIDEPEVEECKTVKYTNKYLPGFTFSYKDCEWNIEDTTPKTTNAKDFNKWTITLIQTEGEGQLEFRVSSPEFYEFEPSCHKGEYSFVANNLFKHLVDNQYAYFTDVIDPSPMEGVPVAQNFDEFKQNWGAPDADYCVPVGNVLFTRSNIKTNFDVIYESNQNYNADLHITYNGDEVTKADGILQSMKLNPWPRVEQPTCNEIEGIIPDSLPDLKFMRNECLWDLNIKQFNKDSATGVIKLLDKRYESNVPEVWLQIYNPEKEAPESTTRPICVTESANRDITGVRRQGWTESRYAIAVKVSFPELGAAKARNDGHSMGSNGLKTVGLETGEQFEVMRNSFYSSFSPTREITEYTKCFYHKPFTTKSSDGKTRAIMIFYSESDNALFEETLLEMKF